MMPDRFQDQAYLLEKITCVKYMDILHINLSQELSCN